MRRERETYHVGIGGAGNKRSSSQVSARDEEVVKKSGADLMTEKVFGYFVR